VSETAKAKEVEVSAFAGEAGTAAASPSQLHYPCLPSLKPLKLSQPDILQKLCWWWRGKVDEDAGREEGMAREADAASVC